MSAVLLFAWTCAIVAGSIGSAMVCVALIEALPSIIRSTVRRNMNRRRV